MAYIEYILRGGISARDIHWNGKCYSKWSDKPSDMDMVLVDGKQRLTAVLDFIDGKFKAFGHYIDEFEGELPIF